MYLKTYIFLSFGFGILFLALLLAAVVVLGMAVSRWKQPSRSRRLKISCGLFAVAAVALAVPQILFKFVDTSPQELTAEDYRAVREEMRNTIDEASHVDTGDFAPNFSIDVDDGTSFTLSECSGSVVLINFFRTDCGPCNLELPVLQEIWEKYGGRDDFRIIAISRGETMEAVETYKRTHGLTLPVAIDENSSIYEQYASHSIPRTYLVARDGTIGFQSKGFMRNDKYDGDSKQIRREVANALVEDQ